MSNSTDIIITAAKGRPMLSWVGKRPLSTVTAFPAQHIESFDPSSQFTQEGQNRWADWPAKYPQGGLLFHGDNKEVLAHLLANGYRGQVKLIYIDPPFDSGADYVRNILLRGNDTIRVEGEGYSLGEQVQYTDIWANDNYLQFMYERLLLLKELLAEDGSLYLHCDWHRNHQLRCLTDEIFGSSNLVNEIIWQRTASHNDPGRYGVIHDVILFYRKGESYIWNTPKVPHSQQYFEQFFIYAESPDGKVIKLKKGEKCPKTWRRFRLGNFASPHPRPNLQYEYKGYAPPTNGWKVALDKMKDLDAKGRLFFPEDKAGRIQTKSYWEEVSDGKAAPDLWIDILAIQAQSDEREDYPTQKPETLVERVISASTNVDDLVLDCFIGSGTTAAVAQKLGRQWIGCDINKGAIQTTAKRLQSIITEQMADQTKSEIAQGTLNGMDATPDTTSMPAQRAFTVWRVNDYDLQIQHNEAVELACEHIGIERTRNDSFFDGTLGRELVKIIPFGHPLSPLDLEEIRRELEARQEEDRNIAVVCLGKELAADAWLEDWNRLRTGANTLNRLRAIELRTDPKYGKFFEHRPADAQVHITRDGEQITVTVAHFISPSILERLQIDANLLSVKLPDWRSMVDCIMIDPAYNGEVFNVALSDIPVKKTDLVQGVYTLPAPAGETTVAVKIIDMLGEEVLVVAKIA